ncbi:MAG: hypothetical protein JNM76_18050 [Betaproteobacteria bacterium]|nr:hypothetical protein [Betaproteobacteria bacterium]
MLVLKLAIVPAFILGISLAGQRWGPAIAGWLSGLPVVAGPILFFMAREQGAPFAAEAAVATASAVCGSIVFSAAYSWAATKHRWPLCLLAAAVAYFLTVAVLAWLAPGVMVAALMSLALVVVAPKLFPDVEASMSPGPMPRSELAVRMVAGATLVFLATWFASSLGPRLSGLVAMFPVLGTVLAVFSHRHAGAAFTTQLLRGMAAGFYAFITFCVVLALTLAPWGIGASFAAAIVAALAVQGVAKWLLLRPRA